MASILLFFVNKSWRYKINWEYGRKKLAKITSTFSRSSFHAVGFYKAKPLIDMIVLCRLKCERLVEICDYQHQHRTTSLLFGNTKAPICVRIQDQADGLLTVRDDANESISDAEISLLRSMHTIAILEVLVDAIGWVRVVAPGVSRDNAELELLGVLVAVDAYHEHIIFEFLGLPEEEISIFPPS